MQPPQREVRMPPWLSGCSAPALVVAVITLSVAAGVVPVVAFLVLRLFDPGLDPVFVAALWGALAILVQVVVVAGVVLHYWLPRSMTLLRDDGRPLEPGGIFFVAFLPLPPILVLGGVLLGQLVYGEPDQSLAALVIVHASSLVVVLPTALHRGVERLRRGPAPSERPDADSPAPPSECERRAFLAGRARPTAVVERRRRPFR